MALCFISSVFEPRNMYLSELYIIIELISYFHRVNLEVITMLYYQDDEQKELTEGCDTKRLIQFLALHRRISSKICNPIKKTVSTNE